MMSTSDVIVMKYIDSDFILIFPPFHSLFPGSKKCPTTICCHYLFFFFIFSLFSSISLSLHLISLIQHLSSSIFTIFSGAKKCPTSIARAKRQVYLSRQSELIEFINSYRESLYMLKNDYEIKINR